jgi:hypothetical protein
MKTFEEWENTEINLDEYLNPLDEIDEGLALYFGEIVPPHYDDGNFTQVGEASFSDDFGTDFYGTVWHDRINKRYYYLGDLPEFK